MNKLMRQFQIRRVMDAFKKNRDCNDCSDLVNQVRAQVAAGQDVIIHGLAVPFDTPTGDGREVARNGVDFDLDESSVPIIWDREDGDHSGMTIGKVDKLRAEDSGLYVEQARLFATDDEVAADAVARVAELIAEGALGWSAALDDEEIEIRHKEPDVRENSDGEVVMRYKTNDDLYRVLHSRLRHLALVDTPAFPGARPQLGMEEALAAAAAIATYPADHFVKWESSEPVPLTVTKDGRVYGHAAGDGCLRAGDPSQCRKYTPDPDKSMRNFHTGTATLDDGSVVRVGALTSGSLHADTAMGLNQQRQYHENTSTVWAKVQAWNDLHGRLCVSGSVVPGLDKTTLAQVSGSPVSVELWPVPGVSGLTLVGAHTVNTPAWPVAAAV